MTMNQNKNDDVGDFEVVEDPHAKQGAADNTLSTEPVRVRIPRGKEIIGVITQRLGGNRMEVKCTDGKTRNCRVPGRFKRSLWLRPKDTVIVEAWEYDNDKGDVIFKYSPTEANQLRKKGLLSNITLDF